MMKRRVRMMGGMALVVALLLGGIWYTVLLLTQPAHGSVSVGSTAPATSVAAADTAPKKYQGTHLSFTYPPAYQKLTTRPDPGYLEVIGYYASDHTYKHIAIAVIKESLGQDSGLTYRKLHPESYHQDPNTQPGPVFYKSDANGVERTAFIAHDGLVASVSITCPFQTDLTGDLQTITSTLAWR